MELVGSEIIVLLTSPAVLLSAAVMALVLLSGLAARVPLYFEHLGHRWQARSVNSRPRSARYRAEAAAEMGFDQ